MKKMGYALALIGVGGLAEAYNNGKQILISLLLIGIGALLMRFGNEKNSVRHPDGINILDRLFFLPR